MSNELVRQPSRAVSVERIEAIENVIVGILNLMANQIHRSGHNSLMIDLDKLLSQIGQPTTDEILRREAARFPQQGPD